MTDEEAIDVPSRIRGQRGHPAEAHAARRPSGGPLEGSRKSIDFVDPVRDGAVLPVLHLNGYKMARAGGPRRRPRWPAIVLRSPKG